MIPITLTMRNFMCYRDHVPALHFEGIHLACLSGDNGNGKSAIIDAMTWALWGQARAKSDDDLIYLGQADMEVEFDFAVGKQPYRIIRKRSKPKRRGGTGQTILEFQIATGDGFSPITGNSIAQTQQHITDVLHMDYPTFINSAFLRQGHADEFTNQTPAKRKEVLGNILELSLYDDLEGQARELYKRQETAKEQLERAIKEIRDELAQKPAYNAELEQAQGELSRIEEAINNKSSRLNELREQKAALEKKKAQLEQIETHTKDAAIDLKLWHEQVAQHLSRLDEYEKLIAQRSIIEDGYALFAESRKLSDELDQKLRKMAGLNERKHHLEMTIARASQELLKDHALTQGKINELEAKAQHLPELKNQLGQTQADLRQLAEQEETVHEKKGADQELQAQVTRLESSQTQLQREINELGEKLDLLAATQTEARCPLCETELGAEGLKLIEAKYIEDRQGKSDSLKSNQAELAPKKTGLETLKSELSRLESRLNQERTASQSQANMLLKEIADSEETAKRLAEARQGLPEIEQRLAMKDFAAAEQEALKNIEDALAGLDYDAELHEQAQHRLAELEQYGHAKRNLDEADRLISQEKETVARTREAVQKLQQNLEADNQQQQALTVELVALPGLLDDLAQTESETRQLTEHRHQAQEIAWSVKAKLQRLAELEVKKKAKESMAALASKEEGIYRELVRAFGKGGIQALLIETALPEIEDEANRLLGRMTDNRMHVKFETQRETKKGNVIETLDINISDELGTRNYEMFSGGEAFRIDLSIRIALSKMLARRAGAPLPTLIIDEGFGTQDSTGIEKLKETINSIQDDFEKIIVITHIEELRDAFPTRIDVVKTPEGSTISVN